MKRLLEGQAAIITGSGRGIGREVALLFAEQGASVIVSDKDEGPASEVVSTIRKTGGNAVAYCGDVTAKDFGENAVNKCITEFGRLDILVNNAGYTSDSLVHKMTDEQFQSMLDIHLITPFRLIRAAAPYMRDEAKKEIEKGILHHRKIVNVSSGAGVNGNVGQANYSAAKAGVIGLTKTIGKEWAPFNINTNAVAYGVIDTRLTRPKEDGGMVDGVPVGIPGKVRDMFINKIPQKRVGTAREAAEAIFYLSSPLSNYVNGQVLQINGGL